MTTSIRAKKHVFVLDCPDAGALAAFYARLLGWSAQASSDSADWVDVVPPEGEAGGLALACQQVDDYRAPEWPDGPIPQQAHLDFTVSSIERTAPIAESAGATRHPHQPSEDGTFTVFLDPAGHPFCLCEE
ncbi:VOC family protein [Leucobacter sp. CSA1]|uniref:VOC family protein n=1 Tax=Leucobacter chromiisoli TaxID=2796471 RepID=A0A934Q6R5_9MICO|nr:VOC family protein [Leucobacter chromiisoli]MBK0417867.1 VOC family protein [Leucobacter chromiisoli]